MTNKGLTDLVGEATKRDTGPSAADKLADAVDADADAAVDVVRQWLREPPRDEDL